MFDNTNDKIELLLNGMKEQIKTLCAERDHRYIEIQNENYELHNKISVKDKQLEEMSEKLKLIEEILKPTHKNDSTLHNFPKYLGVFKPSRTQNTNFELEEKLREISERYKLSEDNLTRHRNEYSELQEKFGLISEKNKQFEKEVAKLRKVLNEYSFANSELKENLELFSEKNKQSEEEFARLRKELNKTHESKTNFETSLREISERYNQDLNSKNKEIKQITIQYNDVSNKLSQKETEIYENQQKYDENIKEIRNLR
ncbi:9426_t:CDS:1, partial [Funneliformis geosporum]